MAAAAANKLSVEVAGATRNFFPVTRPRRTLPGGEHRPASPPQTGNSWSSIKTPGLARQKVGVPATSNHQVLPAALQTLTVGSLLDGYVT